MKIIKRFICAALAAAAVLGLCSCARGGAVSHFLAETPYSEAGKICASAYEAYYNETATLTDSAGEEYETFDGEFTLVVAITNNTQNTKILTDVTVKTLYNQDGVVIAQDGSFEIDNKEYLVPGKTSYISCVFNEDEVLTRTDLSSLTTDIELSYHGCVKDAPSPEASDEQSVVLALTDAEFDEVGGLAGKIALRNNFDTAKTPTRVSFDIVTDSGKKVTTEPIVIEGLDSIAAGELLTVDFAVLTARLDSELRESSEFDMLYAEGVSITTN